MKLGAHRTKSIGVVCLSYMSFAHHFTTSWRVASLPITSLRRMRATHRSSWFSFSTAIFFPTLSSSDVKGSRSASAIHFSQRDMEIDSEGRLIRKRSQGRSDERSEVRSNEWDSFDPLKQQETAAPETQRRYGRGGWVGDNDGWDITGSKNGVKPKPRRSSSRRSAPPADNRRQSRRRSDQNDSEYDQDDRWNRRSNQKIDSNSDEYSKINLRDLEIAGFDHLYGLSSVLNALQANKRNFAPPNNMFIDQDDEYGGKDNVGTASTIKPEAQLRPYLFVQDPRNTFSSSQRLSDKQIYANKIVGLAEQYNLPIAYVNKGVLNTLSNNRPHQGFVLRCGKLNFNHRTISTIPIDREEKEIYKPFWLVLDEVVDPQNLGAILRTAYFLGFSASASMGILICQKNSAPPSAVVSSASAGALEILMQYDAIYSTSNLIRTLANAEQNGCRIVGASSDVPYDSNDVPLYDLQNLPRLSKHTELVNSEHRPTVLVLGSEGHGLRALVAKSCTEFVRIPSAIDEMSSASKTPSMNAVDSLNVSVTAGILLWHFVQGLRKT